MERYSRALHNERQAVEQLEAVHRELEVAWEDWRRVMVAGCAAALVAQTQTYFQAVTVRRLACLATVRRAEQEVQATHQAMIAARQDREAVDLFLDHQRWQYDRALDQEERKVLDDLAQRRSHQALIWSASSPVAHD